MRIVTAFIRGEVAASSAKMVRPSQWVKGNVHAAWSGRPEKLETGVEILAMESVSFPEPPPLIGTPEKQNLNKFCDYHGDRGHNTNDCYQLKKQIEEVVASGKLAHLVKDIRRNNKKSGGQGRNNIKVINMIRGGENSKRPFGGERSGLTDELTFPAISESTDG
ncbi:hypothetical protein Tco_1254390 [Tanacetum coccineum]